MTTEERAQKIVTDDYFDLRFKGRGRKTRIPSKYVDHKIKAISTKIGLDLTKLSDPNTSTQYAMQLNGEYALEMTKICAFILYGRNRLYNSIVGDLYMRYKVRRLFRILNNQDILDLLLQYVEIVNLPNFIQATRFFAQTRE